MNQSDQELISEEDNTSSRGSDVNLDEDSVDIISTDCGDEDFDKRSCGDVNVNKNKFSIANILGLEGKDVKCSVKIEDNADSDSCENKSLRKVKCVKPTPISARNTGNRQVFFVYQNCKGNQIKIISTRILHTEAISTTVV